MISTKRNTGLTHWAWIFACAVAACSGGTTAQDAGPDATASDAMDATIADSQDITSAGDTNPESASAPTFASLDQANMTLAGGANATPLDPSGQIQFMRTTDGSSPTGSSVTIDGHVALRWEHHGDVSTAWMDRDLDGVFERRFTITRNADPTMASIVIENDPTGQYTMPARRDTFTPNADQFDVVVETADSTGALQTTYRYTTPQAQPATITGPSPGTGSNDCSGPQAMQMRADLQSAITRGLQCLRNLQMNDAAGYIADEIATRGIELRCGTPAGVCQVDMLDGWLGANGSGPIGITCDPSVYFSAEFGTFAAGVLEGQDVFFHELLHTYMGAHETTNLGDASHASVRDPVYACAALCFEPTPTRCQCAACLGTNICDPRCAMYAACDPNQGAQCDCVINHNWYDTLTACTVDCPSGIACFAAGCNQRSLLCPAH